MKKSILAAFCSILLFALLIFLLAPAPPRTSAPLSHTERARAAKTLVDLDFEPVDFVIVIKFVYCAVSLMIERLNRFHRPRCLVFVVFDAASCDDLRPMADNVRCFHEDTVIDGFTRRELERVATAAGVDEHVQKRLGSYYLQFINIQVARYVPWLSSTYIVYDADQLPVSPTRVRFFDYERSKVRLHMMEERWKSELAYHTSYTLQTGGLRMLHRRNESFIAHFMPFRKAWCDALLARMTATAAADDAARQLTAAANVDARHTWMARVIANTHNPAFGPAGWQLAFADYDFVGSMATAIDGARVEHVYGWWRTHHVRVDFNARRDRLFAFGYVNGSCCVPPAALDAWQQQDVWLVTFEIAKIDGVCARTRL